MEESRERATAHHEAGHAVIAYLEGIEITSISIVGDKDSDGWLIHRGPFADVDMTESKFPREELDYCDPEEFRGRLRKKIRICMAGALAEKKLYPGSAFERGAEADYEEAGSYLVRLASSQEDMDREQQKLWAETESLINEPENWNAICRLAEEVLEKKELSGKLLTSLLQDLGQSGRTGNSH